MRRRHYANPQRTVLHQRHLLPELNKNGSVEGYVTRYCGGGDEREKQGDVAGRELQSDLERPLLTLT